jgi:hypothetical protein
MKPSGRKIAVMATGMFEVLCHHGLIYPKGGNILLAYANRGVKRHIAKLPSVEHHQWDDDAEVFRFPAELLDTIAAVLKAKRLSGPAEPTEKQREVLKLHAFKGGPRIARNNAGARIGELAVYP